MNTLKKNNIINDINSLLLIILNEKIINITVNTEVDRLIYIIKTLNRKKPIHISIYTKMLVPITTTLKCINCNRIASYQNINHSKDIYCWIHSQYLNNKKN
jgi:hypothetical protein